MTKERMTKFRWFWAWKDEEEEKWLEEMSRQGLHLAALGFPGFYHFVQGEPRTCSYRLDFRTGTQDSLREYRQICRDAGWEELGRLGSWYYFRKEDQGGDKPEFFSDTRSKVQKYQRLLVFLLIFLPILLNGLRIILQRDASPFQTGLALVYALMLGLYGTAILRLLLRIRRLKNS